jgi:hypothetical protein
MTLETNLSLKPYFDDYRVTKNFYRVLYRPAAAVQARELNQMQTILQDQIDKFGRHIFKEGSVIEGCGFTFDNSYNYVKIRDNYANNSAISNVTDFLRKSVINSNGLRAGIVNVYGGFESNNPDLNTLYLKYLNSGTYANGSEQTAFSNGEVLQIFNATNVNIANVVVATVADSAGKGYAFTTTSGVIFKKGFFIRVAPQTLVVSKYNNVPDNISVGFEANEEIITSEIDTSLLDNAAGSPNYDAPGAHRLKLIPVLVTRETSSISNTTSSNTTSFFSICDFKNGLPISIKNDPQYAALAKEAARRTYETNGDYVVNPFFLSTSKKISNNVANTTYNSIVASPGIGYVKGYRVEYINNNTADLRKGTDYATVNNQIVTATFGYYFNVTQFCGDFDNKNATQVELHSVAKTAVSNGTFLATTYSANTKIGTAYVRGINYYSGTPGVDAVYDFYVFNITMLPGQKISDVRSIINYNSGLKAVADIILDKDFNGVDVAKVQASNSELMIYPFGQNAIRPEGFSTTAQYVYRNRVNSSFLAVSGSMSLTIPAVVGTGTEIFKYGEGVLSNASEKSFIVIPSANGYSNTKTGTVSINATSANVVGSSTAFLSQYQVGDYFLSSANTRRVVSVTSDALMTVDSVFSGAASGLSHQKVWPAGVPINFSAASRNITITSGTTATVSLGETSNADFTSSVYFDTLRLNTVPIAKQIKRSTYVRIQANTHYAGVNGPWCLGIPDVVKLNAVYIDETGANTYLTTNLNVTNSFAIRNGQQDSFYGLAYLISNRPIAPNSSLLVSVDNFVASPSQGVGFFTAASYPVDDVNTSNTSTIRIYEIPQYTSSIGESIDLRDSIDFRPYAVNTALASNTTANTGTINPSNTLTLQTYGGGGAYLVSPDSNYVSRVQYYYPRKDRISLTIAGQILVTEGDPSLVPSAPNEVPGTMTIGFANIPPYPSLTPDEAKEYNRYDYAVQTTIFQTKRYTMADINKLSKRIEKLEYYTSLSLLEQSTNSLLVRSDSTGLNRFKNGILVDPFKDHSIGNTNDGTYNISIDRNASEARPTFNQKMTDLWFDQNSSSAKLYGDLILIPFVSVLNQGQNFASKYRNCIQGNLYNYRGVLEMNPVGITAPDVLKRPTITGSIDNYTNFVGGGSSSKFGTEWGNWTDIESAKVVNQDSRISLTASSQSAQNFRNTTTTTLEQQQKRVGRTFTVSSTESTISTGDYVSDVSIQTFVPSRDVFFRARGMKPNSKIYAFFDNVDVNNHCLYMGPYDGQVTRVGGAYETPAGNYVYVAYDGTVYVHNNNWGGQIYSDAFGNVYGVFKIPPNIFKSGSLEFKLTDISNLDLGQENVTTQASYVMFCSALSVQFSKTNLTVRSPVTTTQEVTEFQTIQKNTVDIKEWEVKLPPPPVIPDPPTPVLPLPNTFVTVTPNTNITVSNNVITPVVVENKQPITVIEEDVITIQPVDEDDTPPPPPPPPPPPEEEEITIQPVDEEEQKEEQKEDVSISLPESPKVEEPTHRVVEEVTISPEPPYVPSTVCVFSDPPEVVYYPSYEPPVLEPVAPIIEYTPVEITWVSDPQPPVHIEYRENGDGTIIPSEVPYVAPDPGSGNVTYDSGFAVIDGFAPRDDEGNYIDINIDVTGGGSGGE